MRQIDLSAKGQHNFQCPEVIEHNHEWIVENMSRIVKDKVAKGEYNFVADHPAKKRLMKIFNESESTHCIDIYDISGKYHRQWPTNKAWPPIRNSLRFESGTEKRRKGYRLAELKGKGVTPNSQLHGIGTSQSHDTAKP